MITDYKRISTICFCTTVLLFIFSNVFLFGINPNLCFGQSTKADTNKDIIQINGVIRRVVHFLADVYGRDALLDRALF